MDATAANHTSDADAAGAREYDPDLDAARRFLDWLGASAGEHVFQTFADDEDAKQSDRRRRDRGERPRYARTRRERLDDIGDELIRLNNEGAGVYAAANAIDGARRTAEHVERVRVLFADLDGAPLDPVLDFEPRPHCIVCTSAGRYLVAWRVDGVGLDEFAELQKALAHRFDGDASVHDLPRVIRVPGFYHRKHGFQRVDIVELDDDAEPVDAQTMRDALADDVAAVRAQTGGRDRPDVGTVDGNPDLEALRARGYAPTPDAKRPGRWFVTCPNAAEHTTDGDGTDTVYIEAHTNGYAGAGFHCSHAHCSEFDIHALRRALGVDDVSRDGVMRDAEALTKSSTSADVKDVLRRAAAGLDAVEHDDVIDTIAAHTKRTKTNLRKTLAGYVSKHGDERGGRDQPAADKLVRLATNGYRLGVSTEGEPFAVPHESPRVVRMLRGSDDSLRAELARDFYRETGRAAPQQALADALAVLEGMAREAEPESLHLRVARDDDGAIWLDLGDTTGRAVRVDATGWTVEAEPAVLFKRTAATGALPEPERGGTLDQLWRLVNVCEADRPLCAAWIVAGFWPDIPHPGLAVQGEQGTGKTGAAARFRATFDPSPVAVGSVPRDEDQWINTAYAQYVVGLDNVSTVPGWLSDALCRASTGDGDLRRRKYTDAGVCVFKFRRVVVLTSIDLGAVPGDLGDRMLQVELERIDERARRRESELEPEWRAAHPRVLGAVLDLVAACEAERPRVQLNTLPRMADFAYVLAAVDRVLGTDGYTRYGEQHERMAADAVESDPFARAIAENVPGGFDGTSKDLLARIPDPDPRPRGWPVTAREVTTRLHRLAPNMRAAGWTVDDDGGRNHTKSIRWTIQPAELEDGEPY